MQEAKKSGKWKHNSPSPFRRDRHSLRMKTKASSIRSISGAPAIDSLCFSGVGRLCGMEGPNLSPVSYGGFSGFLAIAGLDGLSLCECSFLQFL